ncbi:MAG: DUF4115 domain-containing protein, partial [Pseudomonadota bacterium]|nr:DUF4115 domain-containing protein [Pseudomonadota bacterium]
MSDNTQDQPENANEGLRFPSILQNARIANGLTLEEIAKEKRLNLIYLEALEAGDMPKLPQSIFTRSYIRQLSDSININPEPLIEEYNRYIDAHPQTQEMPEFAKLQKEKIVVSKVKKRRSSLAWVIAVALLAAIAFFVWQWMAQGSESQNQTNDIELPMSSEDIVVDEKPSAVDSVIEVELGLALNPGQMTKPATANDVTTTTTAPTRDEEEQESENTQNSTSPTPDEQMENALVVRSTDAAWIRVVAAGQRVFQGVLQPQSPLSVTALPPVQLTLGNASQVQVIYQGEMIDLSPYIKSDVAKLTLS